MLPVAVDLDAEIIILLSGVADAFLHRGRHTAILLKTHHLRIAPGDGGSVVARAVVDHQRAAGKIKRRKFLKQTADGAGLVKARYNSKNFYVYIAQMDSVRVGLFFRSRL